MISAKKKYENKNSYPSEMLMSKSTSLVAPLAPYVTDFDLSLEKVSECHGASEQLPATLEHGPVNL